MNNPDTNKNKDPKVLPSDQVKVKWLKPHPSYAYNTGNICFLSSSHVAFLEAESLLLVEDIYSKQTKAVGPFIEILSDDYQDPVTEKKVIPEPEMIKVKWIKVNAKFAYRAGAVGYVTPENLTMLIDGGFVVQFQEPKPGIWRTLTNRFNKKQIIL